MSAFPESAILSINDHVLACDLDQSLAILNQTTGTFYTLDEVGKFVWQRLEGRITIGGLKDAVVDAYDCDPETAASDIHELISDLSTANLIGLHLDSAG